MTIVSKDVDASIICYCAGGLGNRLMPMASCWAIAQRTGRRLKILWRDNDMRCQAGFAELFNHPQVDTINDYQLAGLSDCKIYADFKDVYENFYLTRKDTLIKLIEKSGIHDRTQVGLNDTEKNVILYHNNFLNCVEKDQTLRFFESLKPVPQLQEQIEKHAQQLAINKTVIGVHARGTDFHVSADQYAEKINIALRENPDQRFLVCSDDQAYEKHLHQLFPKNIIIRSKQDFVRKADDSSLTWVNNTLTSKASVLEAIIDIYLLARTDFKIYHEGSSFAQLILILQSLAKPAVPPEQIPADMVQAYTMNGRIRVNRWYINESNRDANLHYSYEFVEQLVTLARQKKSCNYGDTDQWLYKMLELYPIKGKTVLVMGSQVPFYEAICIANDAFPTTVEFQQIKSDHPRLKTMTVDELYRSQVQYDAAISISTFEHTGLGRYGDPLDPDGDLKAMMLMRTRVKHNGLLFLSIPMSKDIVVWNAHRIYGKIRFPHLVAGWDLLRSIGSHQDSITYKDQDYFQPVHVLQNNTEKNLDTLSNLFRKHPNPVFIETGTLLGRGVKAALQAGFTQIHSIEVDDNLYAYNRAQFEREPKVHLYKGKSEKVLPKILSSTNEPVTFWLDAHRTGGGLTGADAPYPIISEVDLIKNHAIKTHTFLIDDRRLFEPEFGVQEKQIKHIIKAINPGYSFSFADSGPESESGVRQDILVAAIECGMDVSGSKTCLYEPKSTDFQKDPKKILYFCPDVDVPSAGIRRLYRHVSILNRHGYQASILHNRKGFSLQDQPDVPVTYLEQASLDKNHIVVIPEGQPQIMHYLRNTACRRFVIALNWDYIYKTLPDHMDWRDFNIERVMVVCPMIGDMISWAMRLPYHVIDTSIDADLFYYDPAVKQNRVVYIERKAACIGPLRRLLHSRNDEFIKHIEWVPLSDLGLEAYADHIRKAFVFLNLSGAEGMPTSCMEAMQAGALVSGFDGVGGRGFLKHKENCLLAPANDYVSLAFELAPLLSDMLSNGTANWEKIRENALASVMPYTPEAEMKSIIEFWQSVL